MVKQIEKGPNFPKVVGNITVIDYNKGGRKMEFVKSLIPKSAFVRLGILSVGFMGVASYGLSGITQIRYDHHDKKTKLLTEKEELKLKENQKPFNIQEAYFELTTKQSSQDWDFVRVPRPKSLKTRGE
ncbi:Cytochrome oxidase assembly [Nowakowskiella sp. JEL0407]|nr:Cytochrome oxidase assembly [Nowakowskiella sp. JEL0407]